MYEFYAAFIEISYVIQVKCIILMHVKVTSYINNLTLIPNRNSAGHTIATDRWKRLKMKLTVKNEK